MAVKIGAQPGVPDVPLTLSHTFCWSYNRTNRESERKTEMEKKHPQVHVKMNTRAAVDTCSPVNLPASQHWHSSFWKPSHPHQKWHWEHLYEIYLPCDRPDIPTLPDGHLLKYILQKRNRNFHKSLLSNCCCSVLVGHIDWAIVE